MRELLERTAPLVSEHLGPRVDEYLYFAASIFWRASARAWSEDTSRERFALGSTYDEQFRLYLLGEADFPRNGRLFVHVWSDDPIGPDAPIGFTTLAPCTGRIDGEGRHKFCIPGVTFILFLGGLAPARHDARALKRERRQQRPRAGAGHSHDAQAWSRARLDAAQPVARRDRRRRARRIRRAHPRDPEAGVHRQGGRVMARKADDPEVAKATRSLLSKPQESVRSSDVRGGKG